MRRIVNMVNNIMKNYIAMCLLDRDAYVTENRASSGHMGSEIDCCGQCLHFLQINIAHVVIISMAHDAVCGLHICRDCRMAIRVMHNHVISIQLFFGSVPFHAILCALGHLG